MSVALLLVLTPDPDADPVLPALELLEHRVRRIRADPAALVTAPDADVVIVDARDDLRQAKSLCTLIRATGLRGGLLLVVTEGGLSAVGAQWGADEVVLNGAGPAEVDARIRLAIGRVHPGSGSALHTSGLWVDEKSYSAKLNGRPLDLTYTEFQLLHFLATHPSRVFTREQLLAEVWGYDYYGGTRTVDVHVRRLRAKLGDQEQLIGTVRNVGYRFTIDEQHARPLSAPPA